MNARLLNALRELADVGGEIKEAHKPYTMGQLANIGLVELIAKLSKPPIYTWRITPAGRAKLDEMEQKK